MGEHRMIHASNGRGGRVLGLGALGALLVGLATACPTQDELLQLCPPGVGLGCHTCGDSCDTGTKGDGEPCCQGTVCIDHHCRPKCSTNGTCPVCNAETCWDGCCDKDGKCQRTTPFWTCGTGGVACQPDHCSTCDAGNCPSGCCSAGACRQQSAISCGTGGAACADCAGIYNIQGCRSSTGKCANCVGTHGDQTCQTDVDCCDGNFCHAGQCTECLGYACGGDSDCCPGYGCSNGRCAKL